MKKITGYNSSGLYDMIRMQEILEDENIQQTFSTFVESEFESLPSLSSCEIPCQTNRSSLLLISDKLFR